MDKLDQSLTDIIHASALLKAQKVQPKKGKSECVVSWGVLWGGFNRLPWVARVSFPFPFH